MFCGHCGQPNPDTNTHCDSCGKEIRFALNTVPTTAAATGERSPLPNVENYSGAPTNDTRTRRIRAIFFNQQELRAGWRLLIYVALMVPVAALVISALRLFGGVRALTSPISPAAIIAQELVLVFTVLVPAVIMARIERRTLADYGLPPRTALGRNFWIGCAWGLGALTLLLLVLRLNRSFVFGNISISWKGALVYGALWAFAMYLVGVGEEFMLRGYSQFTLTTGLNFWENSPVNWKRSLGFWLAAGALSLLFAALHVPNPGETKVGIGSVVAIALFFVFTLYRTGSLWFAIGMHAAWNWGQTFLYGVPNSGMIGKGHLFNPTIGGPEWYSGGTAGPEGSVLIFPLIALLFVVFDRAFPKGTRYPAIVAPQAPAQDVVLS
jgi:uncharacterized protein